MPYSHGPRMHPAHTFSKPNRAPSLGTRPPREHAAISALEPCDGIA